MVGYCSLSTMLNHYCQISAADGYHPPCLLDPGGWLICRGSIIRYHFLPWPVIVCHCSLNRSSMNNCWTSCCWSLLLTSDVLVGYDWLLSHLFLEVENPVIQMFVDLNIFELQLEGTPRSKQLEAPRSLMSGCSGRHSQCDVLMSTADEGFTLP